MGREVLPEASVGVGVHGPEVQRPIWIEGEVGLVSDWRGKCCKPGYSVEQQVDVRCVGGELESGPAGVA